MQVIRLEFPLTLIPNDRTYSMKCWFRRILAASSNVNSGFFTVINIPEYVGLTIQTTPPEYPFAVYQVSPYNDSNDLQH